MDTGSTLVKVREFTNAYRGLRAWFGQLVPLAISSGWSVPI